MNKQAILTNVCKPSQELGAVDLIINFAYEVNPRAFSLRNLGHKLKRYGSSQERGVEVLTGWKMLRQILSSFPCALR